MAPTSVRLEGGDWEGVGVAVGEVGILLLCQEAEIFLSSPVGIVGGGKSWGDSIVSLRWDCGGHGGDILV